MNGDVSDMLQNELTNELRCTLCKDDDAKLAELLQSDPGIIDQRYAPNSSTLLNIAVFWGRSEIAKMLLAKKQDLIIEGDKRGTPLYHVIDSEKCRERLNDELKRVYENLETNNYKVGKFVGCDKKRSEVIEVLLNHIELLIRSEKNDLLHRIAYDPYLLEVAVNKGREDIVNMLFEQAESFNVRMLRKLIPCIGHDDNNTSVNFTPDEIRGYIRQSIKSDKDEIVEVLRNKIENMLSHKECVKLLLCEEHIHNSLMGLFSKDRKIDEKNNNGFALLHFAAYNKNEKLAEALVKCGTEVDIVDAQGNTPLHIVAENGNTGIAKLLLDANPKLINYKQFSGKTPVCIAVEFGHKEIVEMFLESSQNRINGTCKLNEDEIYFLLDSAINKDIEVFKALFDAWKVLGEGKNEYKEHLAGLYISALNADCTEAAAMSLEELVKQATQETTSHNKGFLHEILYHAVIIGNAKIIEVLFEKLKGKGYKYEALSLINRQVDGQQETILAHIANCYCSASKKIVASEEVIQILLNQVEKSLNSDNKAHLDESIQSGGGNSGYGYMLRIASCYNRPWIIQRLRELECSISLPDDVLRNAEKSPLYIAVSKGYDKVVKELLEEKLRIKCPEIIETLYNADSNGNTALHIAASKGSDRIVGILLDKVSHLIDRQDGEGRSPLDVAADNAHYNIVEMLLEKKSEPNQDKDNVSKNVQEKDTPLHIVASRCSYNIVEQFFKKRIKDIDQENENGHTPLHRAILSENLEAVQVLLENGADISIKDKDGKTPLNYAEEYKEDDENKSKIKQRLEKKAQQSLPKEALEKLCKGMNEEAKRNGWEPLPTKVDNNGGYIMNLLMKNKKEKAFIKPDRFFKEYRISKINICNTDGEVLCSCVKKDDVKHYTISPNSLHNVKLEVSWKDAQGRKCKITLIFSQEGHMVDEERPKNIKSENIEYNTVIRINGKTLSEIYDTAEKRVASPSSKLSDSIDVSENEICDTAEKRVGSPSSKLNGGINVSKDESHCSKV